MSESTFATLDLVPLLLQVLNDPSTYPTLRDLVIYYFEGSHGQSLAASLRVCNSPRHLPSGDFIDCELAGLHFKYLDDDDTITIGILGPPWRSFAGNQTLPGRCGMEKEEVLPDFEYTSSQ